MKSISMKLPLLAFSLVMLAGGMAAGASAPASTAKDAGAAKTPPPEFPSRMQKILHDRLDTPKYKQIEGFAEALGDLPAGAGNAAEQYAKVPECYGAEIDPNTGLVPVGKKADGSIAGGENGIAVILAATKSAKCQLVPVCIKPMETMEPELMNQDALIAYVNAMVAKSALLEKEGKSAEAEELLRAIIIMGWHFSEDRPNVHTWLFGLAVQDRGAEAYEEFLTRQLQSAKSIKVGRYRKNLKLTYYYVVNKSTVLLGSYSNFESLLAAIVCLQKDEEIAWRQEACVRLGVFQHGAPDRNNLFRKEPAQQKLALEALQAAAKNDPQANVRKLAQWCLENITEISFAKARNAPKTTPNTKDK